MGKKNKNKNQGDGEGASGGPPPQQPQQQQQRPQQPSEEPQGSSNAPQSSQQASGSSRQQQQEQQKGKKGKENKPQQQQSGGGNQQQQPRAEQHRQQGREGGQQSRGEQKQSRGDQPQQQGKGGQKQQQQQQGWGDQKQQQQRGDKPQQQGKGGPKQQQQQGPGGQKQQQPQGWGDQKQQQQQRGDKPQQQGKGGPKQQQQQGPGDQPQHQGPGGQKQQQQGRGGQQQGRGGQQQQQGRGGQPQQQPRPDQQRQQGPGGQQQQWGQQQQQAWGAQQQPQQAWGGKQQQGPAGQQQQGPGGQQQQWGQQQQQQGRGPQQQHQRPPQQQHGLQQQQQAAQRRYDSPASSVSSSSASTSSVSLPLREGPIKRGTIGQPGEVETNYLVMNLDKMPDVAYHYDVSITPDRPKKFMRPAFEQFNKMHFPDISMAFDGRKSFYTIQRLERERMEVEVTLADSGSRTITFKVAIQPTDNIEVDLKSLRNYSNERIFDKPMRALQCLEVVLSSPCHHRGVRAGRSFYTKPKEFYDLSKGYEMWVGLYQAAILGDQPFLNVDISHKSFPSASPLVDFLKNNYNCNLNSTISDRLTMGDFRAFIKSINIVYEPPQCFGSFPRTYKVNDVSNEGAAALNFTNDQGTRMNVAQYFASRGYKLKYPNLNCLHVGSTTKNTYLPIELCKVPEGQTINKKDGRRQVQQMIRYAATSTNVRKEKILNMMRSFQHNLDMTIQRFGIKLGAEFLLVPMRLLKAPMMEYYSRELIRPMNGSWRMNDRTKFLNTKTDCVHKWAIIYSDRSHVGVDILGRLASMLSKTSSNLNMSLAEKPDIIKFGNIDNTLRDLKSKQYHLVIVLIPFSGASYADIKQSAELKHGILTQCIRENTVTQRLDGQLILNLLLKINAKMCGTNHKISADTHIPLKNVMFLGADVTHPSPDQRHIPSVVGVAASHDANGACYNMQYRLQPSTVENIEDMQSIFSHHMNVYFQHQGHYPEHIIYYRDGVSDGQFPIVRKNELAGIRAACAKLKVKPKLTCIIVVKRHHTRFFPKTVNPRDKFNNVTPGTVVDRVIVHPNEVQFFMVSHQSIQGTAKPTRYNVIEDDAKMDINLLQTLTYNLCHLFPRCNRSVSYPAPAYLAHLVAFRGRVYIEGALRLQDLDKEYKRRLVNEGFMKTNPMYFV